MLLVDPGRGRISVVQKTVIPPYQAWWYGGNPLPPSSSCPYVSALFSLSGTYERSTFCTFWQKEAPQGGRNRDSSPTVKRVIFLLSNSETGDVDGNSLRDPGRLSLLVLRLFLSETGLKRTEKTRNTPKGTSPGGPNPREKPA